MAVEKGCNISAMTTNYQLQLPYCNILKGLCSYHYHKNSMVMLYSHMVYFLEQILNYSDSTTILLMFFIDIGLRPTSCVDDSHCAKCLLEAF